MRLRETAWRHTERGRPGGSLSLPHPDGQPLYDRHQGIMRPARQIIRASPGLMGTKLGLFSSKTITWVLVTGLGLLVLDYGVSLYQRDIIEKRQKAKARLQRVALFNLRADVADLTYGPSGTYRLTLSLDNPFPEEPLYVMVPSVQAYVQVGFLWKEVPSRPAADQAGTVVKLAERRSFDYVFEPNTDKFEELIPGYLHVRFSNVMLVSQRSQPKDDLVDRTDNYYVYLKPHSAYQKESSRKPRSPGREPLWIPMPPH